MYITLGDDTAALEQAAEECGLQVIPGPVSFHYTTLVGSELPDWIFSLGREFDPAQAEYALKLLDADAALCSRRPHEVGVFENRGRLFAVWDGDKDGYGLNAIIGRDGARLKAAYVIAALGRVAGRLGMTQVLATTDRDETTTLEYTDAMSKKIIVRIAKDGATTVKTEGFEGTACKDATKQLEQALGTVTDDQPTQEMYTPPEQHTTIGGS